MCIYRACGVVVAGEGCEEIFLIIATSRALDSAFAPGGASGYALMPEAHVYVRAFLECISFIPTSLVHQMNTILRHVHLYEQLYHVARCPRLENDPFILRHRAEQNAKLPVRRLPGRWVEQGLSGWITNA